MSAPRIIVPMRSQPRKGLPTQFIHQSHADLLLAAGALPVPVPAKAGLLPMLDDYVRDADGLLLAEGGDIGPQHNRVPDGTELKELDPDKDLVELALARRALDEGLPVLATCRGAQVINLVTGGTLYGHLPRELGTDVTHVDGKRYDTLRHPLGIRPGSPLHGIYGQDSVAVTSVHHQGVRELGTGLVADARSPDGLIEAFHAPDHPFLIAVQHHPERQLDEHPGHAGLYRALVAAARGHRARRAD
jgi:putative glutamine amidotransferase